MTQPESFINLGSSTGPTGQSRSRRELGGLPEGRQHASVMSLVWAYSNALFGIALSTQGTGAIPKRVTKAFETFRWVPEEVWWDIPQAVTMEIFSGRGRTIVRKALTSHDRFRHLFCRAARGNDKPVVATPITTRLGQASLVSLRGPHG